MDGEFTGAEWDNIVPLEGVLTDLYLDYRDGYLYAMNDWRVNREGVEPDCFNRFNLTLKSEGPAESIEVRVYGDGRVEVERDGATTEAQGAYGFGPGPRYEHDHTRFEFRIRIAEGDLAMCLADPVARSTCQELTAEPVTFLMRLADQPRAGRRFNGARQLSRGMPCGDGSGACADGLQCLDDEGPRVCTDVTLRPDAGPPPDGGPPEDGGPPR